MPYAARVEVFDNVRVDSSAAASRAGVTGAVVTASLAGMLEVEAGVTSPGNTGAITTTA